MWHDEGPELAVTIAVRVTEQQAAKLKRMERQTRRKTSDILRLLIDAAEVVPAPPVRLNQEVIERGGVR